MFLAISRRRVGWQVIASLVVLVVGITVAAFKVTGAIGTAPDSCPTLGPIEDVNFTTSGVAQVHDNTGKLAEIELNRDYSSCRSPELSAIQTALRKGFAHGEAVLCGQRQAYLAGSYNPPPSLGLKQDPETRATVAATLTDRCDPQKFKDSHWGISLDEAAK
jgi:hypothetical protein